MKTLANASDRQLLLRRVMLLQPNTPRSWGRMSAHQMLCHLRDSFQVALGQRHASAATSLFQRIFIKRLALYSPLPWPKGVPTRPEVEQGAGGTPPREFSADRDSLIAVMDEFANPQHPFALHPTFGRMSVGDWMRWGYLHMDHHLRQFGV